MSSLALSVSLDFTLWVVQTSSMLITYTQSPGTRGQMDTPMDTAHTDTCTGGGTRVDKHTHTEIHRRHIIITHRDMYVLRRHMLSRAKTPWTCPKHTTNNNITLNVY